MATDSVALGYVHPNEVTATWQQSVMNLVSWDLTHAGHLVGSTWIGMRCYGSDGIAGARDKGAAQFLAETDAEWLWWVDTDMGFAPDTLDRLLEVADPVERPIVGALCFAQKQHEPDGMAGWVTSVAPTIFDWVELTDTGEQGFRSRMEYPVNALVRCAGTGAACILIHRSVLYQMAEKFGTVYERAKNPTTDERMGEDLSFCMRAGALDVPIYVHTGVRTTHFKPSWLGEEDFWRQLDAPPATEHTAILVPAMRHTNAQRFMDSLRASTSLATVYAIAAPGEEDAIEAWRAAGAQTIKGSGATFAERMNLGYRMTDEPWVFITGDDVTFRAGWLDHAQAVAGSTYDVVGTNDLGNPRVTSGEHATHLLIRRSYADDHGASWDGPQSICHEGYRHWFVDDEIVLAAKQRNAWAMALGSIVEHHHPLWGKAEDDAVYRLGQSFATEDQERFEERVRKHAS